MLLDQLSLTQKEASVTLDRSRQSEMSQNSSEATKRSIEEPSSSISKKPK